MKASAYLLLSTLVLIPASRLAGQTGSEVSHAPDAGISERVHGINVEAIPGAPFTAKEIVKITTHLDGGAVVEQKYFAMIVRDSRAAFTARRVARFPSTPIVSRLSSTPS